MKQYADYCTIECARVDRRNAARDIWQSRATMRAIETRAPGAKVLRVFARYIAAAHSQIGTFTQQANDCLRDTAAHHSEYVPSLPKTKTRLSGLA
jgi:hypothetical protein